MCAADVVLERLHKAFLQLRDRTAFRLLSPGGVAVLTDPGVHRYFWAAVLVHLRRKEGVDAVPAVVLGLLAVFLAWGRFGPYAF